MNKLSNVVKNKYVNKNNNDDLFLLKESVKLLCNMIRNLVIANLKQKSEFPILKALTDMIGNCDKYTYQTVKTILYNLVINKSNHIY